MTDPTRWQLVKVEIEHGELPLWWRRVGDRVQMWGSTDGRDPNEMTEEELTQGLTAPFASPPAQP